MEKFFFKKGNSPTEHSPFRADFQYDDPVDNTISILVRLDLTQNQDAPPIEVGTPYILHLTKVSSGRFWPTTSFDRIVSVRTVPIDSRNICA